MARHAPPLSGQNAAESSVLLRSTPSVSARVATPAVIAPDGQPVTDVPATACAGSRPTPYAGRRPTRYEENEVAEQRCMCQCGELVEAGRSYAGETEGERSRHRARRQQQLRTAERVAEKRQLELRVLLTEAGLVGLPLLQLVALADQHAQLAQALTAEVASKAAQCDEVAVVSRIEVATRTLAARLAEVELENASLREDAAAAAARLVMAEARAASADADAAAIQRRLDRLQRASG